LDITRFYMFYSKLKQQTILMVKTKFLNKKKEK